MKLWRSDSEGKWTQRRLLQLPNQDAVVAKQISASVEVGWFEEDCAANN